MLPTPHHWISVPPAGRSGHHHDCGLIRPSPPTAYSRCMSDGFLRAIKNASSARGFLEAGQETCAKPKAKIKETGFRKAQNGEMDPQFC